MGMRQKVPSDTYYRVQTVGFESSAMHSFHKG